MHCGERDQYQNVRHPDMRNIGASHFRQSAFSCARFKNLSQMGLYGTQAEPKYDPVIFGLCSSAPNFT